MAVYAMKAGKYAAVEVPAGYTLEECWELVNTHEKTGVPCMMLENWSFRGDNLAVLNMIRMGLPDKIVHCHCARLHDCMDHWFSDTLLEYVYPLAQYSLRAQLISARHEGGNQGEHNSKGEAKPSIRDGEKH